MSTLMVIFYPDKTTLSAIVSYVKKQGTWARLTNDGTWLVKVDKSAALLRDELMTIAPGNRIAVINVTNVGWATSFKDEVTEWMKENL